MSFFSSYNSDDNEIDVYYVYQSFQSSSGLFSLLDSTFEPYDEDANYDGCVLQFTQPCPLLHWSIYLQTSDDDDEEGGPVFDVFYDLDSRQWERKERQASQV